MNNVSRVVLIGFSGSGKSTVARLLAEQLGWRVVDTDADIEHVQGMSVPEIFARLGEPFFRELERQALRTGIATERVVIATGGGAVVELDAWGDSLLRRPGTVVIALDVEPKTVLDRLQRQQAVEGRAVERPMIAGEDPLGRICELKSRRQSVYDQADVTLVVDRVPPQVVAGEIVSLINRRAGNEPTVRLRTASALSDIHIGTGVRSTVGSLLIERWPKARRVWVISDEIVGELHAAELLASLSAAGLAAGLETVPSGEASKSWSTAGYLLDRLLDGGIERTDVVIALGGGVIGDLAGFVAATVLRGVPLVQIPTSLLAMVDSSIGGKTGVNHRTGKNLIGAFYQPPLVLIDPTYLQSLPQRELNAGWAEIVKHAVIQPSTPGGDRADLLTFLERNKECLRTLSEPAISYAITRNVALKAGIVEADEREFGIRAYLNFGHTLGHGIEAAGYSLLHGEAVAVGIRGVMRLASMLGTIDETPIARVDALLDGFGLPRSADVDEQTVVSRMASDKKRTAGKQRWVIPVATGGVTIMDNVPNDLVRRSLRSVTGASAVSA